MAANEEALKKNIRSVLESLNEVLASKLQSDYREFFGQSIPFASFGCANLNAYIQSIPDVVQVGRNKDGDTVYKAKVQLQGKTAHLAHFTKATKKKKSSKATPKPAHARHKGTHYTAFGRGGFSAPRGRGGHHITQARPRLPLHTRPQRAAFGANLRFTRPARFPGPTHRPAFPRPSTLPRTTYPSASNPAANLPSQSRTVTIYRPLQTDTEVWDVGSPPKVKHIPKQDPSKEKSPARREKRMSPTVHRRVICEVGSYQAPPPPPPASTNKSWLTSRSFGKAIGQLRTQETKQRVGGLTIRVSANEDDETVREAKVAAAHAVSSMRDVPPRFRQLSTAKNRFVATSMFHTPEDDIDDNTTYSNESLSDKSQSQAEIYELELQPSAVTDSAPLRSNTEEASTTMAVPRPKTDTAFTTTTATQSEAKTVQPAAVFTQVHPTAQQSNQAPPTPQQSNQAPPTPQQSNQVPPTTQQSNQVPPTPQQSNQVPPTPQQSNQVPAHVTETSSFSPYYWAPPPAAMVTDSMGCQWLPPGYMPTVTSVGMATEMATSRPAQPAPAYLPPGTGPMVTSGPVQPAPAYLPPGTAPVAGDTAMSPGEIADEADVSIVAETIDVDALPTDYKTVIKQHSQRWKAAPQYDVIPGCSGIGGGYACVLRLLDHTHGSGGVFKTAQMAEIAAARQACEALGLLKDERPNGLDATKSVTNQADVEYLRDRVQKILQRKTNGLWSTRLAVEYVDQFGEDPPVDLFDLVKGWTDIATVESVDGTNKQIVYPCTAPSVRLTEQDSVTLSKIADAQMPQLGVRIPVVMSQTYDCSHFYVQCNQVELSELMGQIQDIYEARGSPKSLISAEPGMYAVAKFTDDLWYRVQILAISRKGDETNYDVLYVDYGNCETVSMSRVHRILDNLCTLPAQAVRCGLASCFPPDGDTWDENSEAVQFMQEKTEEVSLFMEVQSVRADKGCSVRLYHPDVGQDLSSWLVQQKMASPVAILEEPPDLVPPPSKDWDVYVCFINTTTDIVVRLVGEKYSEQLTGLESYLGALARSSVHLGFDKDGPKVGSVCMMISGDSDDMPYNRVRVLQIDGTKAHVQFLDHGDSELVNIEQLQKLPPIYNQLPYQAIPAKLTGLQEYENDETVREKLMDLAFGKTVVATCDTKFEGVTDRVSLTLWDTSENDDDEDVNINELVAQVINVEDLAPKLPGKGGTLEGYVSHIGDDGTLYFQVQGPGLQALERLTKQFNTLYESESSATMFVSKPEISKVYACKYDATWYRVRLEDMLPGRKAEVHFLDCGNNDVVQLSRLREIVIEGSHFDKLPPQAVACHQFNLPPPGLSWTSQALDRLSEISPTSEIRVLEVVYPGTLPGNPPQVEVYYKAETEELVSMSEILTREIYLFEQEENSEDDFSGNDLSQDELEGFQVDNTQTNQEPGAQTDSNSNIVDSPSNLTTIPAVVFTEDVKPLTGEPDISVGPNNAADLVCAALSNVHLQVAKSDDSDSEYLTPRSSPERSDGSVEAFTPETALASTTEAALDVAGGLVTDVNIATGSLSSVNVTAASVTAASVTAASVTAASVTAASVTAVEPPVEMTASSLTTPGDPPAPGITNGVVADTAMAELQDVSFSELEKAITELLPAPPPLEHPKGGEDLYITWVSDPSNFWAVKYQDFNDLQALSDSMADFYSQDLPCVGVEEIKEGEVYAVLHEYAWYRGTVKGVLEDLSQVKIHFADFGDFSIVETSQLRVLAAHFRKLPLQAFQCKLEGIRPASTQDTWDLAAVTRLTELIAEKAMTAWIHGNVESIVTHNSALSVTLVDSNNTQNAFIHKILLEEGLACK